MTYKMRIQAIDNKKVRYTALDEGAVNLLKAWQKKGYISELSTSEKGSLYADLSENFRFTPQFRKRG